MAEEIYLGLDIGTNSCGWALTDDKYNLLKIGGKDTWGVRLFREAETKADRRLKRTTRRRMVRKRLQNSWLRELFKDEINKVDDKFFDRLQYSNLWQEDKLLMNPELNGKYSLFNDIQKAVYTDRDYYKQYKTVYHLRSELLEKPADDIRLLYLAIHSMLTHRGHFLSGMGQADGSEENVNESTLVKKLFEKLTNLNNEEEYPQQSFNLKYIDESFLDKLTDAFNELKSMRAIKERLELELDCKTKLEKEVASIFVSGKSSTNKLFYRIEKADKIDFDFDSDKFETEIYGKLQESLTEDEMFVIDALKNVFSRVQLSKILGKENQYVCKAMVKKYEKHQQQLKEFKDFVRKYYPSKMSLFFRKSKTKSDKKGKTELKTENNYARYINSDLERGGKQVFESTATREDFYSFVKKQLENLSVEVECDKEEFEAQKQYFINLMDKNDFLLKIRSRENAVIPNGLYIKELKQILKTNSEKYPFLKSKDSNGLSVEDKIISVIEFRVPYFVGPIGVTDGERVNGWAEKECDLELRPWTLDKIINFDKAEDSFIQRMTNKCSYLPKEDVLPKDSLLFSKFRVLNELNKLKINGNSISVEQKQLIFNKLFKVKKKVSKKDVEKLLIAENICPKDEEILISGIDKDFANNYSSYVTLKEFLGEDFVNSHFEDLEKIIKYHTILSDKSRLADRLKREFDYLTDKNIKDLKSLNFSKWGSLSEKFLKGILFEDRRTGEVTSVIDALWSTNNNLMELMGKDFTLSEKLMNDVQKLGRDLIYDDVDGMYCSPAVKRGAWQAIQIINEIKSKIGRYPNKIFVEVTRGDDEKGDAGRKNSRIQALSKLYNNKDFKLECKKNAIEYDALLNELNKKDNTNVRSDRLYLYFLQLGKCMYTGEPIEISELYNDNLYDIDHIIPQSKLKDDSLNNRVLVKKDANLAKGDIYPIYEVRPDWVGKQKSYWEMLQKHGFISQEKLSRLLRKAPFTDADANDFVNRQMVVTNQETTAVIGLLKSVMDNPNDIVFSKARYVSDFRKKYKVHKSRNVNDFHHAKDAYLNIVVGNTLKARFTERYWKREEDDKNRTITANINKLFDSRVWSSRCGRYVWNGAEDVKRIQQVCDKNTCLVSIMPFSNENGEFYDSTIYKGKSKQPSSKATINIKGNKNNPLSNMDRYGGYNSLKGAYFMVVESLDKKGKPQITIETVPILINYTYRNAPNRQQKIVEYLEKENNIKITKVILDKLKYDSLLKINGGLYKITGKSNDRYIIYNANQWYVGGKDVEYIKIIEKYLKYAEGVRKELVQTPDEIVVAKARKDGGVDQILSRSRNIELFETIVKQLSKSIYNISCIPLLRENIVLSKDKFCELSIDGQARILNGLVMYLGGADSVDLSLIGLASSAGKCMINKNITDQNISLICQSVTGILQKEIKFNGI